MMDRRRALMTSRYVEPKIPNEYQEVEWIGTTTRGAYIQTDTMLTNGCVRYLITFSCASVGSYGSDIFGTRYSTSSGEQGAFVKNNSAYTAMLSPGNVSGMQSANSNTAGLTVSKNTVVTVDGVVEEGNSQNAKYYAQFTTGSISGIDIRTGATGNNARKAVSFFGSASNSNGRFVGKVYGRTKCWNDGRLVLNLVPCYRKSDDVIGVYDVIDEKFYANAGTNSFIKGADV